MASEMAPSFVVLGTFLGLAMLGSNAYRLFNEDFKPRKTRQGTWGWALEQRDVVVAAELKKEANNVANKDHSKHHS